MSDFDFFLLPKLLMNYVVCAIVPIIFIVPMMFLSNIFVAIDIPFDKAHDYFMFLMVFLIIGLFMFFAVVEWGIFSFVRSRVYVKHLVDRGHKVSESVIKFWMFLGIATLAIVLLFVDFISLSYGNFSSVQSPILIALKLLLVICSIVDCVYFGRDGERYRKVYLSEKASRKSLKTNAEISDIYNTRGFDGGMLQNNLDLSHSDVSYMLYCEIASICLCFCPLVMIPFLFLNTMIFGVLFLVPIVVMFIKYNIRMHYQKLSQFTTNIDSKTNENKYFATLLQNILFITCTVFTIIIIAIIPFMRDDVGHIEVFVSSKLLWIQIILTLLILSLPILFLKPYRNMKN